MITQTIKRWLGSLFAWWPWRRSPETSYKQAISNMNTGVAQESMLCSAVDGPLPQTGITSVAVEQGRGEDIPELNRPATEERPEHVVPSHSSSVEEPLNPLHIPNAETRREQQSTAEAPPPSATPEQKLAFLHYLVKRGIVNEGFNENNIPKQYRKPRL